MASESDLEKYFVHVYNLVLKAGQIFREGYYKPKKYETKTAYYDLVTEYDRQIEELLINGISSVFPDHKFIGEEETAATHEKVRELTDDPTWIIDPIDGTANFIHMIPHACISIGLTINKENVIGIVYNPISNEMFTAKKGQGALLNGKPIHVSDCKKIQSAIVAYEISLIHAPSIRDKNVKRLYHLGSNATGTRSFGCAALSLSYVANGSIDCYHIEDLMPWDMAAGVLLIREAGGVVYHTSGSEFNLMKPDLVCASSESLCQDMIQLIKKANDMNHVEFV